jgi:hypothetical protein
MRRSSLFLNNRYHDPTLGTFISVDPLVQITGEPDTSTLQATRQLPNVSCVGQPIRWLAR